MDVAEGICSRLSFGTLEINRRFTRGVGELRRIRDSPMKGGVGRAGPTVGTACGRADRSPRSVATLRPWTRWSGWRAGRPYRRPRQKSHPLLCPLRQPRTRRAAVRGTGTPEARRRNSPKSAAAPQAGRGSSPRSCQADPLVCKRCGGPLRPLPISPPPSRSTGSWTISVSAGEATAFRPRGRPCAGGCRGARDLGKPSLKRDLQH